MSRLTDLLAQAKVKDAQLGADLDHEFKVLSSRLPLTKLTGATDETRALSPQTLFHFTKTKAALFGILESNFKPTFSTERIYKDTDKNPTAFGAPMVSFCDLRLSELHDHMGKYGCYGMGMCKKWANRMGLNTVYYINRHSQLVSAFERSIKHLFSVQQNTDIQGLDATYTQLLNFNRFMKNYEGPLFRSGALVNPNYRFADEREWRYVPEIEDVATFLASFAPIEAMEDPDRKQKFNSVFEDRRLIFEPKDIRYIIVAKESERDEVIRHIRHAKGKNFPRPQVVRLQSRIISAEQIMQDI